MVHPSHRSSPLLSTLGIVALAGTAAPLSCRDDGGEPPPIDDFADVVDVYEGYYAFYCECYAELYGDGTVDECLAEAEIASDSEVACLADVFDSNPAAFEVLRCQAEVTRGLLGCRQAEGCPTPFSCGDGNTVPDDFVCDGFPDCSDGADEAQDCPPPPMCADGQPLDSFSVCDGFENCADGSDEVDCPEPFVCGDGTEIAPEWVCDNDLDCEDGSDEQQMCPETCERRWLLQQADCGDLDEDVYAMIDDCYVFVCADGNELPPDQVCDGMPNCPDGEDEQACPSETASGG